MHWAGVVLLAGLGGSLRGVEQHLLVVFRECVELLFLDERAPDDDAEVLFGHIVEARVPLHADGEDRERPGSSSTELALDWLEKTESDLSLDEVNVFNKDVEIVLHGTSDPKPLADLREVLEEAFPQMDEALLRINVARTVELGR